MGDGVRVIHVVRAHGRVDHLQAMEVTPELDMACDETEEQSDSALMEATDVNEEVVWREMGIASWYFFPASEARQWALARSLFSAWSIRFSVMGLRGGRYLASKRGMNSGR